MKTAPCLHSAPPAPHPGRAGWGGAFLLGLLLWALPAQARPQALVVVADHLTLADVTRPDLPGFGSLLRAGHLALMSPGLAHGPDPVATVYATLGAGDSISVGDVSQGRLGEALQAARVETALIGDADGDDTGPDRPALLLLPVPDSLFNPTRAAPTSPGGRRTDPTLLWAQTDAAFQTADCVVVHFGDFARLERENQAGDLLPAVYAAHRRRSLRALDRFLGFILAQPAPERTLMLVVPTPPLTAHGRWDQLTPFLVAGPTVGAGPAATLTSDTTQTPGLVAARDLAPTLLDVLHIPPPLQMTGAPVRPAGPADLEAARSLLRRLDRQTRLNQEAQDPLFWGIGLIAPALLFPSLALFLAGRMTRRSPACRFALSSTRLLAAWPLALLFAPLFHPVSVGVYLGTIAALTALIGWCFAPLQAFSLTAVLLLLDGLWGTPLVSQSVLSAYALAGIRFYGIGNEYMGLLLGGALLAAATTRLPRNGLPRRGVASQSPTPDAQPPASRPSPGHTEEGWRSRGGGLLSGTAFWFALVTLILSCPSFGAKAGGAITASAVFTLAWLRLRGVPLKFRHGLAGLAIGFGLVFLWALLGDVLHLRRTHLETAVGALEGGRLGYIWGVSVRKVGLAVRVFLHPGTLLGVLALALLGLMARTLLWPQVADYYAAHRRLAAVSEAGLWGGLVCVLFNDSGIVAAILLLMCLILPVLHGLFQRSCAFSPSMSATSESASPFVTFWRSPRIRWRR